MGQTVRGGHETLKDLQHVWMKVWLKRTDENRMNGEWRDWWLFKASEQFSFGSDTSLRSSCCITLRKTATFSFCQTNTFTTLWNPGFHPRDAVPPQWLSINIWSTNQNALGFFSLNLQNIIVILFTWMCYNSCSPVALHNTTFHSCIISTCAACENVCQTKLTYEHYSPCFCQCRCVPACQTVNLPAAKYLNPGGTKQKPSPVQNKMIRLIVLMSYVNHHILLHI